MNWLLLLACDRPDVVHVIAATMADPTLRDEAEEIIFRKIGPDALAAEFTARAGSSPVQILETTIAMTLETEQVEKVVGWSAQTRRDALLALDGGLPRDAVRPTAQEYQAERVVVAQAISALCKARLDQFQPDPNLAFVTLTPPKDPAR